MPQTEKLDLRCPPEFIATIDRIREAMGIISRAAVIRMAVKRLADTELNGKKSGKKSCKSS